MTWLLASCALIVPLAAPAAEPMAKKTSVDAKASKPDLKFLEYLGTLEGEDENWTDLAVIALEDAQTDTAPVISKVKRDAAPKSVVKSVGDPATAEKK
ncbi:MAG TPA: hypothetical protein VK629_11140 [Steroidobacteraceae bacterium]|nr:hypothetical protein [Steroidobacteraceae bacterium]